MKPTITSLCFGTLLALLLSVSAATANEAETTDKKIPVSVTTATTQTLEVWQLSQGKLQAKTAPTIAAEVDGRVIAVQSDVGADVTTGELLAEIDATDFRLAKELAAADIKRLQALIEAQRLQVNRLKKLLRHQSVNESALDDAQAQLGSLQAQLIGAKVRLQQANRNISKTRIVSPVKGRVTERKVSVGDYLNHGTPVFRITTLETLQARLPFPQALASRLQVGQPVRLTSPVKPGSEVMSEITVINPEISPSNLAINVIVDVPNPGGWEPGASVTGEVRIATHRDAVVVAEGCVVRRPSGLVVYKVDQGKAIEVPVSTGLRDHGNIEILSGIKAGDRLALDGAAYLTNGVSVDISAASSGEPQ